MTPKNRCKPSELSMEESAPLHQHFSIRTVQPIDAVLGAGFFAEVSPRFRVGDCLRVLRYASDKWEHLIEVQDDIRVVAIDGKDVSLHATKAPVRVADRTPIGFEIESSGPDFAVRFDGQEVVRFLTAIEADEYVARHGFDVRSDATGAVVTHLGQEVQRFDDSRSAWAFVTSEVEQLNASDSGKAEQL